MRSRLPNGRRGCGSASSLGAAMTGPRGTGTGSAAPGREAGPDPREDWAGGRGHVGRRRREARAKAAVGWGEEGAAVTSAPPQGSGDPRLRPRAVE